MEIIEEIDSVVQYLRSNMLNQFNIKIKEGDKLNLIMLQNYSEIKNMEKCKTIEYLYSKILLPNRFNIKTDSKNIISSVE